MYFKYNKIILIAFFLITNISYSHVINSDIKSNKNKLNHKEVAVHKVFKKDADSQHQTLVLNKLILLLKKNNSFSADFVQKNYSLKSSQANESKGIIKIQQPNKFYFEITSPDEVVYISNGMLLWQYNKDLMQVIKKPISQNVSEIPLMVLTKPDKSLLNYFQVKEIRNNVFLLTSLDTNNLIHQILIVFSKNEIIEQFQILNTLQERIQINFSKVKHVNKFSNSVFDFKIPQGVDVLS